MTLAGRPSLDLAEAGNRKHDPLTFTGEGSCNVAT